MRGTLAVAAREIVERKLLFLGAFVAGILPLGFPLLPYLRRNSPDARSVAVLLVGVAIVVAFPLAFGATILVGDITQKRLSFYFSRPLSAASIWAGKVLGALLITIGCAFLAVAPVFLAEGAGAFSSQTGGLGSRDFLVLAVPGVLLLLLLAHVVASMARLRSAWIVLDFTLAVFFPLAFALLLRRLVTAGFWNVSAMSHPSDWFVWWVEIPLIATLLVAGYVQVADGRTDARRSHGALSATLWGLMALLALPLAGLVWWVNAATPTDLVGIEEIHVAPRGSWVSVSGRVRARGHARESFLYDTESGRFIKRPGWQFSFSADGTRAAWIQAFERKRILHIAAFDSTEPAVIASGLEMGAGAQLALSPSGRRLAVSEQGSLGIYDISDPSNPKQLAALRTEAGSRTIVFVDDETIRIFPSYFDAARRSDIAPGELEIREISLPSKKPLVTGRMEREATPFLRISSDGRFLVGTQGQRLTLHDGRTGALVATLSEDLERPSLRFLSGGRIAVAGIADAKGVLKIFREGEKTPARSIDLGPAVSLVLGGEIAPGQIAVALSPFLSNGERWRSAWKLALVDVAAGVVSSVANGLFPGGNRFEWWFSPVLPPAEEGSPASRLFLDSSGALVRLDPKTMKQKVLLGGRR